MQLAVFRMLAGNWVCVFLLPNEGLAGIGRARVDSTTEKDKEDWPGLVSGTGACYILTTILKLTDTFLNYVQATFYANIEINPQPAYDIPDSGIPRYYCQHYSVYCE
jgi:hypothetical protein